MHKNLNFKKYYGIILILLMGLFYLLYKYNLSLNTNQTISDEKTSLAKYFSNQLSSKIGQTYEGYDAQVIIHNLPGVVESDFHGVRSVDGNYVYANNELNFISDNSKPQKSDSKTITDYDRLLTNITDRLKVSLESKKDVDNLINQLSK